MRRASAEQAAALWLVAVGAALGPSGLAILTPTVLGLLDPAVPIALAALGLIAGLQIASTYADGPHGAAADAARTAVIGIAVAGGMLVLAPGLSVSTTPAEQLALVAGVSAALSATMAPTLAILASALALGLMRGNWASGALLTAHTAGVAAAIALAGWLLLRRSPPPTERRVFTVALLLLLGGTADYLSMSALLGGLIAGACLHRSGGAVKESLTHDIAALRHPLFAMLLLVAGALTKPSPEVLALAIGYALLRTGGEALAGRAIPSARRLMPADPVFGLQLAIGFAVNALRAGGQDLSPALAVVVIGSVISRVWEAAWGPSEADVPA
jgi:hypothetical protein